MSVDTVLVLAFLAVPVVVLLVELTTPTRDPRK
jgi:hypothetical protein